VLVLDSSDDGWNLLHFCAKYCLCQLAEVLLSKVGAKQALERMDDQGRTPLDIAAQSNHKKLIEVLSRLALCCFFLILFVLSLPLDTD